MDTHVIYLRKSRADQEAEARGEGETLARHERTLIALAKQLNLNITEIYREVVSGETIAARPVMQKLLSEVEQGTWCGVLVMDIDRLSRGSTIDQGIVAQTFKFSDTKIITPTKTYDPNNDSDEEFFEFSLFMSRREYNSIKRRLLAGRLASAKEGKYVGCVVPYGYKSVKLENEKGFSLEIVPEEAEIVRLIFSLWTQGELREDGAYNRLGVRGIAKKLTGMGIRPKAAEQWSGVTIRHIISNPVYNGKIRWGYRKSKKTISGNRNKASYTKSKSDRDYVMVKGRHEAIIEDELFNLAQNCLSETSTPPIGHTFELVNPLAGIIICGICGKSMIHKRATARNIPYIFCRTFQCDNISAPFNLIERAVLDGLRKWLDGHTVDVEAQKEESHLPSVETTKNRLIAEIKKLSAQLDKIHDAFEQGIYDSVQFLERSRKLSLQIEKIKSELKNQEAICAKEQERANMREEIIPRVITLMKVYDTLKSPREKNEMLKSILEKAVYTKEKSGAYRGASAGDFELDLYTRI